MGSDTSPVVQGIPKAMDWWKEWSRQLIKELPKSYSGSYMALLSYQTTPLPWCNLSPSELLIGNKTRTDVPQTASQLTPQWSCLNEFRTLDKEFKEKQ